MVFTMRVGGREGERGGETEGGKERQREREREQEKIPVSKCLGLPSSRMCLALSASRQIDDHSPSAVLFFIMANFL